jgi:hypothetical protein
MFSTLFQKLKLLTEVVSAKLQQDIALKKGIEHVISVHIQKDDVISDNFYIGHMPYLFQIKS